MTSVLDTLRGNGVEDLLPADLTEQLSSLGIQDVTSSNPTPDVTVVRGTVLPLTARGLPQLNGLPLEAPGLTSGLRVQIAVRVDGGGAVTDWAVDLDLDRVALVVPGLRPAREVRAPARATRLADEPTRSSVRVVGRGVLRIAALGGGATDVTLIDRLDDQTPFGPRGPVATLGFEPPSFFLDGSSFGFTVEELTYDQSESLSPAPKPATWRGLALRRATFYLPPDAPLLGDISVGVENVFLGDPVGVEGTATLEFGGAADTPLALVVEQRVGTAWQTLAVTAISEPGTRPDRVTAALQGTQPPAAELRASLTTSPVGTVTWRLPRGQTDPTSFRALPGDVIEVRLNSEPPTTCALTGTWTPPPTVNLTIGSVTWANVTSVSGRAADLAAAVFAHSTASGTFGWQWDGGAESSTAPTGPPAGTQARTHILALRSGGSTVRRVLVEVRARGPLLVGCRTGAFTLVAGASTPVGVLDVAGTYRLTEWHGSGALLAAQPPATVSGGAVTVPQGLLAEVVTEAVATTGTPPGVSPPPPVATRAHVRFVFDSNQLRPANGLWLDDQQRQLSELDAWVRSLGTAAKFAVVGRCDDLSADVPLTATTDTYNRDLAVRRAQRTLELLTAVGVDSGRIAARGEQTTWFTTPPSSSSLPAEVTTQVWLARSTPAYQSWSRSYPGNETERAPLRRGDIYAYDVTPTSDAVPPAQDGTTLSAVRLRTLVPGADPSVVAGAVVPPPPNRRPQYRVRIEVEWNDPAAKGIAESWPIRAEAIVQWPGNTVQLPPGSGTATLTQPGTSSTVTPVWTLRGRWAHDRTAGTDEFLLGLDVAGDPTGIAVLESRPLAAALGLAPAVIGAASGGSSTVSGEDAAAVGALIAAIGGAASLLLRNGSKTVVTGVTIEHLHRGESGPGGRTRLTVDYVVELSVDVAGSGLPLQVRTQPDKPLKLRYRGVGVEIDTGVANWWDGVGLHARDATPEVVDPGSWQLGPPLDELLRVTGVRSGAQSSWLEVDLALSLDLGVVKLSNATVRIVFGPSGIEGLELRGLAAAVDIPATLKGSGAVSVSSGSMNAAVQLEVIPLKVGAVANLQLGANGFVALMVGVRFPAPIPFGNSGLGLFGVLGRFVSNGTRNIAPGPDPVGRELAWLERSDKYRSEPGQWALGFGAVVGTVPDLGFTFHALGMITVEFPRPTVIFAVIAKLVSETAPVPNDQATRPAHGLSIIGLIVIDTSAVTIALRGHYAIPGLLEIDIPVGAYFPYANPTHSWIHVGTDGQPGREGSRVTVTFLPGILDVRVWAFVMVHGNGLSPGLDGNAEFVFNGFAIGFGAGWEIDWSAGPIRLSASAKVLAGFGTNPLFIAAGIWVRGELDLVVVSVAARGEIKVKSTGAQTDLHGEFCGEVDCFFFSISGCVSIDVSATLGSLPDPPSPVSGVDLVSRLGFATAKAAAGTSGGPTVWLDTIPVVHFAHTVENGVSGGSFAIGTAMPGPVWSGSSETKYAYRLTGVRLEPTSGSPLTPPTGGFPTAWWWPGVRSSSKPPWLSATESEPRDLALLTWEPWTGLLPLTQPSGSPGDPGPLIDDICEPVSRPDPVCVVGELGRPGGVGVALLPEDPAETNAALPPARLRLEQPGDRSWAAVVAVAVQAGVVARPGRVAPLSTPTPLASGPARPQGWRLASLVRGGQELGSLGAVGRYEPSLEDPTLVLEVCNVRIVERKPGEAPPRADCISFADIDREHLARTSEQNGTVLRHDGLTVIDMAGNPLQAVDFDGDGRWALLLTGGGLRVELDEPVDEVTVRAVIGQPWFVRARAEDGSRVDEAQAGSGGELTLRGRGIAVLEILGEGEGGLAEICIPERNPAGESGELLEWRPKRGERLVPPEVVGIRDDGREEPWKPSIKGGRQCMTVVYHPPDRGPWAAFRIAAAPGRTVTVIGGCGIRWYEALERREAEAHRTEVLGLMTTFANGGPHTVLATSTAPSGTTGQVILPILYVSAPPPRPLLSPDTTYRITVDWQWQRWERSGSSQPGSPDPSRWNNGAASTFTFRTAALATPPSPPTPVDLIGEGAFDPRSLARYVTGAAPSGPLPHLLDDPIRVTFSIDYLAALLDRYGFDAKVEVRPTDVATGSVPPGSHPPDMVTAITILTWIEDGVLLPVESAVVEAVTASPCVPSTSLGGTAAEVVAPLDPDRAYDLVLVADRRGSGADVVVARWHFRTSRYRDIDELLGALGLPLGTPTAVAPDDVLLDRQWPTLPAGGPADDAAFDAALATLGLDPWPLSAAPRTTTLWVPPDAAAGRTQWALAGVLLEAPEPIARTGRITVTGTVGATNLSVVRSTANGTRVLLAPSGPVVPGGTDALSVRLTDSLRSRTAVGGAQLLGGPRTIRREVA